MGEITFPDKKPIRLHGRQGRSNCIILAVVTTIVIVIVIVAVVIVAVLLLLLLLLFLLFGNIFVYPNFVYK